MDYRQIKSCNYNIYYSVIKIQISQNMIKKFEKLLSLSVFLFALSLAISLFAPKVSADWINPRDPKFESVYRTINAPFFPKCLPSRGTVVANYSTGPHSIPNDPVTHFGADIVYDLGNSNFLQCFCPDTGDTVGVQTDWLAAGNLPQDQIDNLLSRGWFFIFNGKDWGLTEQPYLTLNITQIMCVRPITPR